MLKINDPIQSRKQFEADLAAMKVGRTEDGPAVAPKQRIRSSVFGVQSYMFTRWSAELTEAQTIEDALDPTFWADIAHKIIGEDKAKPKGRGDIIEVRKLDTGLYAELLIVETGPGFIRTQVIRSAEQASVDIPEKSPLGTKWNVGTKRHDVVRKADGVVLAGNFQTKSAAAAWITDHLKKLAA